VEEPTHPITLLLDAVGRGDSHAPEQLFALIYDELRTKAGRLMAGERRNHTLQATVLVHEAYLKVARPGVSFQSRLHFFNAASLAMRRILVDHADAKRAQKRNAVGERVTLADVEAGQPDIDLLALDEALRQLEAVSPRRAQVVQLRFFAGLTEAQIAELMEVNEKTIRRDWAAARVWLHDEMSK
jgi:RNA polymerase sigma-70 factor, ECF subfamily